MGFVVSSFGTCETLGPSISLLLRAGADPEQSTNRGEAFLDLADTEYAQSVLS